MEASSILKYLIAVTDKMIAISFIMGLLLSAIPKEKKRERWIFYTFTILGFFVGFGLFLIKVFYTKKTNVAIIKLNRQIIVAIFVFSIIAFISWIIKLFKNEKTWTRILLNISGAFVIFLSLFYITPQVYQFTREFVYFGETSISTAAILRAIGFSMGIVVCFVTFLSTYKVISALDDKYAFKLSTLGMFIYMLDYGLRATKSLQRMHIIPLSDIVFQIMIFADNNYKWMIYAMFAVAIMMLVLVVVKNWKVTGEFPNNAARRKMKAKFMKRRRWSYCLMFQALLSIFILSAVYEYDTKEVELAPPQPYKLEDNIIMIPLSDIDDGHLHRFSYKTPNGYDVRFLAVKKPIGTSYGLGLDACEICGVAGYFERGEDVVCKRCDVVMNKATIGFKGGCNPIPFPYEVENETIYINVEDLEREEKRFK